MSAAFSFLHFQLVSVLAGYVFTPSTGYPRPSISHITSQCRIHTHARTGQSPYCTSFGLVIDIPRLHGTPLIVQIYPSASNVVILDTNIELQDTLQFWLALPYRASSSSQAKVEGVIADSDDCLVSSFTLIKRL